MKEVIRAVARAAGAGLAIGAMTIVVLSMITVVAQHRAATEVLERLESDYIVCSETDPRTGLCMIYDSHRIMLDWRVQP